MHWIILNNLAMKTRKLLISIPNQTFAQHALLIRRNSSFNYPRANIFSMIKFLARIESKDAFSFFNKDTIASLNLTARTFFSQKIQIFLKLKHARVCSMNVAWSVILNRIDALCVNINTKWTKKLRPVSLIRKL